MYIESPEKVVKKQPQFSPSIGKLSLFEAQNHADVAEWQTRCVQVAVLSRG